MSYECLCVYVLGTYGSSVGSLFNFARWLFFLNLVLLVVWLLLVVIPQTVDFNYSSLNATFSITDMFTAEVSAPWPSTSRTALHRVTQAITGKGRFSVLEPIIHPGHCLHHLLPPKPLHNAVIVLEKDNTPFNYPLLNSRTWKQFHQFKQWQTGYSPRPPTSSYQKLHVGWPVACSYIFQVPSKLYIIIYNYI